MTFYPSSALEVARIRFGTRPVCAQFAADDARTSLPSATLRSYLATPRQHKRVSAGGSPGRVAIKLVRRWRSVSAPSHGWAAELQDGERSVRQRALAALRDLIHDPERAYEAVHHGCLERLKVLLKDEDASVRTTTAEVLHLLATHSVGREAFLRLDVVSSLSELLDEPVDACRKNVHQALKMMAELPAGLNPDGH
ncbi:hypothetical protein MHYP_G00348190 [Metynnis hypsauchen]